jgi:hypothetical protein
MGCKLVEKVLKNLLTNMVLGKKINLKTDLKICFSMPLYLGMC